MNCAMAHTLYVFMFLQCVMSVSNEPKKLKDRRSPTLTDDDFHRRLRGLRISCVQDDVVNISDAVM